MKKLFGSVALLLALTAPVTQPLFSAHSAIVAPAATVYVCMSKGSVAYHSSDDCAGLNRCTHEVRAVTVGNAQGMGKRACLKCY